jgi:hypothetical protein
MKEEARGGCSLSLLRPIYALHRLKSVGSTNYRVLGGLKNHREVTTVRKTQGDREKPLMCVIARNCSARVT